MCGIVGIFNKENSNQSIINILSLIKYRGKDSFGIANSKQISISKNLKDLNLDDSKNVVGHNLHSIVGNSIAQPLRFNKGTLVFNGEIYNWNELNNKYNYKSDNDAQLLLNLLDDFGVDKTLELLDGVYAFAYWIDDKVYLARDIIGIKPLWFSLGESFAFCSEKKGLEIINQNTILELNPRKILVYYVKTNNTHFINRDFFKSTPLHKNNIEIIKDKVQKLLVDSINKRIPNQKIALLFSGGIDSTMIALILKELKQDFVCYTCVLKEGNLKEPEDLIYAKEIAKKYNLNHKIIEISLRDVSKDLKTVIPLIEDYNVVKVGVALTFFSACKRAKEDGCKVIFSGLGSEEIFAGYNRHKESTDINKECVSGLLRLYERDCYRDDVITMFNSLELRLPFLDLKLVDYALKIPSELKINNHIEKFILRLVAKKYYHLEEKYSFRKKKAAQYGSNIHKGLAKLSHKNGYNLISDFLRPYYPSHNLKLGALISSGKDGIYAMSVMMKQNYSVDCMVTIKSKNIDSYMFHTPSIELVKLQSESIGIPLIEQETQGLKEKELDDLKSALLTAKEKYNIDGIITGALFSTYQRDRIDVVCEQLGLKVFSPLWHMNQETEIREIINEGFSFIITKIAADGLDSSWLGRKITLKDVDKLVQLNKKNQINVAFEGGEAETLMIDGPIFKKSIVIKKGKINLENSYTGTFDISDCKLVDKDF